MHEMWNITYAKADLMFLGMERQTLRRRNDFLKSKFIWKAYARKHLNFIIIIVINSNNKVMLQTFAIENRIQFMTHTAVSKQTP